MAAILVLVVAVGSPILAFRINRERQIAEAARKNETLLRRQAEARAYVSDVAAAAHALDEGNLGLARTLLAGHAPRPGEEDLRGFEWRYLWSLSKGEERAVLRGHSNYVDCVAFSPDGKMLASGSKDHTVKLWKADTGELVRTGTGHSAPVISVAFSPNGEYLATGGTDNLVLLRNPHTLEVLTRLTNSAPRLAFSGHWLIIATGGDPWGESGGAVKLWDYVARRPVMTLPASGNRAAASPDGQDLLVRDALFRHLQDWNIKSGSLRGSVPLDTEGDYYSDDLSSDNRLIATACRNDRLLVKNAATGEVLWSFPGKYRYVKFSPDARLLGCGRWDAAATVWDLETGKPWTIGGFRDGVAAIAFSSDLRMLALGSWDTTIRLYDLPQRKLWRTLTGHKAGINQLTFSPDCKTLASCSDDGTVRLWGAESGRELLLLDSTGGVNLILFAKDGETLASGGDGCVRFWRAPSLPQIETEYHGLPRQTEPSPGN